MTVMLQWHEKMHDVLADSQKNGRYSYRLFLFLACRLQHGVEHSVQQYVQFICCKLIILYFLHPFLLYRTLTVSRFFIFLSIYTQSAGLLGRVIGPSQGLYLNIGKTQHRITPPPHTRTLNIHALIGIRTHDPSVRASEDSSCLRLLGYRYRRK
jgi:hypothetical protein